MKILFLLFFASIGYAQSTDSLHFFPARAGDKWQYRDASINDIVLRRFIDSVTTDSANNAIIWCRTGGNTLNYQQFRVDTAMNVFNLSFQSNYIRYKLNADSGESWIGGVGNPNSLDTTIITMIYSAYGAVFGRMVKIKVFEFVIHLSFGSMIKLGRDYLAEGFGLIRMDVEPGATYFLSGATINQIQFGEPIVYVGRRELQYNQFALSQNYPNPFNPSTTIHYSLPQPGIVRLTVYDLVGREVTTLVNEQKEAGHYTVDFNGEGLANGIYLYRLSAGPYTQIKRMMLVK